MNQEEYNKGGYARFNLSREYLTEVRSRTTDSKGKVWRGEAGRQLLKRKMEMQNHAERNRA